MKSPNTSFRDRLRSGPLVADGALGTLLLARRAQLPACVEELNISAPDEIRRIHEEYVDAGAEVVQTNTFGANRARLGAHGLSKSVEAINRAGVKLAREAAGNDLLVAGSVGPLGRLLAGSTNRRKTAVSEEAITPYDARQVFREQVRVLVDAGVDMILFETFVDADELCEALASVQERRGRIPLVAQVSVDGAGQMAKAYALGGVVRRLTRLGADVVGCNCSEGPSSVLPAIEMMAAASDQPVSAQPSAGLPRPPPENAQFSSGTQCYPCSPEDFGEWARRLMEAGAWIIGGCCGTTPDHIRSVRAVVEKERARRRPASDRSPALRGEVSASGAGRASNRPR